MFSDSKLREMNKLILTYLMSFCLSQSVSVGLSAFPAITNNGGHVGEPEEASKVCLSLIFTVATHAHVCLPANCPSVASVCFCSGKFYSAYNYSALCICSVVSRLLPPCYFYIPRWQNQSCSSKFSVGGANRRRAVGSQEMQRRNLN